MAHRYVTSGAQLPASPSPISQAVVAGDHCYVSGQLATDAAGIFKGGTARSEAELAFRNVFAALAAAGFGQDDLVYIDVAFIDLKDLPEVNDLYSTPSRWASTPSPR